MMPCGPAWPLAAVTLQRDANGTSGGAVSVPTGWWSDLMGSLSMHNAEAEEIRAVIQRRHAVITRFKEELIKRLNLPYTPEDLHEDVSLLGSGLGHLGRHVGGSRDRTAGQRVARRRLAALPGAGVSSHHQRITYRPTKHGNSLPSIRSTDPTI